MHRLNQVWLKETLDKQPCLEVMSDGTSKRP
jgi:hypothetical protein